MSLLQPLLLLAWAATAGPPPTRGPAEEFCREPRTVWCGEAEALRFKDLATNAAPILWFSPDEPLLRGTRTRRIPQKIECARQALDPAEAPSPHGQATVYYQVRRVLVRGAPATATEAAFEDERIPLAVTRKLTLRFFFYYEEDFGFGPHIHDLEGMELQVAIEAGAGGWHRARLLSTKAYAHTSDWQANILQVPEDVVLPLTVLVEEGKHASCPDRNGDGIYTPGYDVNVRVNDAWGVRDIFRSRITGARFRNEEFEPRTKTEGGFTIGPPGKDLTEFAVEQPSLSRDIDWYVAAGARWDRGASGRDASFEGEAGLQARWNLLGFRLGLRARVSDFSISNERLVVEVGLGPFPGGSVRGRE
jgi:hypothetical protein